ncbi:16S rRNA (cytosine(1402)-N(4))-methyltransferase RsmH [Candidatus Kapabacteria bacterium]|nr:16S rRNA (cytosine(1402)-N(4))-methyltransferase RsmH [Candidatus Kapabacteria bacterium]
MNTAGKYHVPVLLKETIDLLINNKEGLYIDGTLGGGGHASEILKQLDSGGKLIAFDKDPEAIAHCKLRFADLISGPHPMLEIRNTDYLEACSIAKPISGLLLDLGVSSRQLDSSSRGISYRFNSPLDMRMGDAGNTAKDLIDNYSEEQIKNILREFGEEPFASPIARQISISKNNLNFSNDLVELVKSVTPAKLHTKTLSRVFQAFRIAVNSELDVLMDTLSSIVPTLAQNGRICIISYHSLEDRIVKNVFRKFAGPKTHINKYKPIENQNEFELISSKPIIPSKEEISLNPRARSAKLRVIKRNFISESES